SLRGTLFAAVALAVALFLWANLTLAARTAAPDVLWELEDQLGLPGRVVIEPLIRRFLPVVLLLIAIVSGLRASAYWETILGYLNGPPFGLKDPVFGFDLGFFVFFLPFWRLAHAWAMTLVAGTAVLTLAVYVLQRSFVLTTRGPRLAGGARTHLLLLGAALLALKAVGFWLDRYDIVFSPRGRASRRTSGCRAPPTGSTASRRRSSPPTRTSTRARWRATRSPSRTSGSGTTARCCAPSPSCRRSGPTTSSRTSTTTATSSTASIGSSCCRRASCRTSTFRAGATGSTST